MQQGERHDGASCEDFLVRTGVETGGCGNEQMAGLDEQVVDGRAGAPVSGGMTFDPSGPGLETAAAAIGLTVTVSCVADFGNQQ